MCLSLQRHRRSKRIRMRAVARKRKMMKKSNLTLIVKSKKRMGPGKRKKEGQIRL